MNYDNLKIGDTFDLKLYPLADKDVVSLNKDKSMYCYVDCFDKEAGTNYLEKSGYLIKITNNHRIIPIHKVYYVIRDVKSPQDINKNNSIEAKKFIKEYKGKVLKVEAVVFEDGLYVLKKKEEENG